MSSIALRANAKRRELRRLEKESGGDSRAMREMRAATMRWIAELQAKGKLPGVLRRSKVA